ncbi:MAG: glycosyltransferase, partial [Anaerolineae bacterium]|nr:glycosyltransferase [Anaerolineae bacterium]
MKIVLLTIGSRGDVQPFVALAWGLQRAGFDVTLGVGPDFAGLAGDHGVPFQPIGAGMQALLQQNQMKAAIQSGNIWSFLRNRNARRAHLYEQL